MLVFISKKGKDAAGQHLAFLYFRKLTEENIHAVVIQILLSFPLPLLKSLCSLIPYS